MLNKYQKYMDLIEQEHNAPEAKYNDRVLLVDFLNTFLRSFAGSPTMDNNGNHCGGISGTLYSIGNAIRLSRATRCILIADGKDNSERRRKIYPDYKVKRKMQWNLNRTYNFNSKEEENHAMEVQMVKVIQYLDKMPVQFLIIDKVEADDVIAYVANNVLPKESHVTIMSSDKDFLQLVDDRIDVWSPTKKKMYDADKVKEDFHISPANFLMYKKLIGDASDNITGIDGIGPKKFETDLSFFEEDAEVTDEILFEHVREQIKLREEDKKKPLQYQTSILESKDKLELNEKVMSLKEVLITDKQKLGIMALLEIPPTPLNKSDIILSYMNDGLSSAIPNIDNWVTNTFTMLNTFILNRENK